METTEGDDVGMRVNSTRFSAFAAGGRMTSPPDYERPASAGNNGLTGESAPPASVGSARVDDGSRQPPSPAASALNTSALNTSALGASAAAARRPPVTRGGIQLLLGYAWLLAGIDKLLLGTFPHCLTRILCGTLRAGTIPGPFASLLRGVVLPNGPVFGVLVESGETLAGLGLMAGGVALLAGPWLARRLPSALADWVRPTSRAIVWVAMLAALGAAALGLTYYLLDGAPWQGFMPSIAFNGALDPGLLLALGSLVVLSEPVSAWLRRRMRSRRERSRHRANWRRLAPLALLAVLAHPIHLAPAHARPRGGQADQRRRAARS